MLKTLLFIGMGSFIGGVLRYLLFRFFQFYVSHSFPLGTLVINILGCFGIGLLFGLFERGNLMNNDLRLFLTVGLCGGFTTFSTFMGETVQLFRDGNFLYFFLYIFASLILSFLMFYLGQWLVK